ncbi:MAG TPA: c-type cytochrome biogenesis protein CcmI [Gemmatimonadaceae bacterium]|nr:c-type cytochrome biogenesis protein CcmI [Gemmatimonadaceae bacterium]
MTALIAGTILALGALAFVLYPLFSDAPRRRVVPADPPRAAEPTRAESAIAVLREVEFDRETGKLSDADYATLKAEYTREALAAMRQEDAAATADDAQIEAAILAYRRQPASICPACGPRPEPDAVYCSSCGRFLAGECAKCHASVTEQGARFCPACGSSLAA